MKKHQLSPQPSRIDVRLGPSGGKVFAWAHATKHTRAYTVNKFFVYSILFYFGFILFALSLSLSLFLYHTLISLPNLASLEGEEYLRL